MEYIDGGGFVSKNTCINIFLSLAISPAVVFAAGCGALALARKSASLIKCIFTGAGGFLGAIVGLAIDYALSQVAVLITGLAYGAQNNGVDIWWNWNIFMDTPGVKYNVNY